MPQCLRYCSWRRSKYELYVCDIQNQMLTLQQEYLGDWGNLMGHQHAAKELITKLYTPKTIASTEVGRKMLQWSIRFDVFASIGTGERTALGTEWIRACSHSYSELWEKNPTNLDLRIEGLFNEHRVLSSEMLELFSKCSQNEISLADFMKENDDLAQRIHTSSSSLDPFYSFKEHVVLLPEATELEDTSIPYKKSQFFTGPLWSLNYLIKDCLALEALHMHQTSLIIQQAPPPDLARLAIALCRIIEAIDQWPDSPDGATIATQVSVGLVCLYVPRNERNIEWCLSKLAKIETLGYDCSC